MTRETVSWVYPFTAADFASKTYTAYQLKSGVNYAQFLGLKSIGTTQRHAHIQDTVDEHMVLQLPSMTEVSLTGAEAPVALYHPDGAAVSHDPDSNSELL